MNRILSITIAIIVIVIAAEAGYYWGIKSSPQSQQLTKQLIQTNKNPSTSSTNQLTPTANAEIDPQKILSQKILELSKIARNGNQIVLSGNTSTAIQDLIKAAVLKSEIDRLNNKKAYPDYYTSLLSIPTTNNIPNDEKLITELNIELKKIDFGTLTNDINNDLAKSFYRLGLISYKNNHKELTLPFWISMVNLSPEWSHFQLELANYYLAIGNVQSAKNSIDYCENFNFPATICDSFLLNEIQNNQPHPIGFMEDNIKTEVVNN
jgi:hypothetical protein